MKLKYYFKFFMKENENFMKENESFMKENESFNMRITYSKDNRNF